MPTPVAHGLAGLILYTLPRSSPNLCREWPTFSLAAFAAAAADLDFLPGLLLGDPGRFHHGVSHSVGAALLFGVAMALIAPSTLAGAYTRRALLWASLYGSHLVLDFFAVDTTPPYGEPIFWPFSGQYFISPWTPFLDVKHGRSWEAFVNWENARAVLVEAGFFLPVWLGLLWARGALGRETDSRSPVRGQIESSREAGSGP